MRLVSPVPSRIRRALYTWAAAAGTLAAAAVGITDPVRTDAGLISGATTGTAGDVRVYKGIPFAAPPVGARRWQPPQPVPPWDGVRACTESGPWCPQPASAIGFEGSTNQGEDCLYLNVWTAAPAADAKLPVMVWIHGGGCTTGSGSSAYYDGQHLARLGAVVVTINYRLGPFGYLAHPLLSKESPHGVSGNYGHLDQTAALAWVRANIAGFGGDPGCVTIFGESAGAMSVCRLMVSPLAKGLFHRAIAQSGGAHGRNPHLRERRGPLPSAEETGARIATALGCDRAPDPLAALRAASAADLLAAANPAQGLYGQGVKFGPIVDGWAIPEDPGECFDAGRQTDVPFLVGSNADEGTLFSFQMPVRHVAGYRLAMRAVFGPHTDAALRLLPCEGDDQLRAAFARFTTLTAFVAPARRLARDMHGKTSPAYLYHFTRVPPGAGLMGLGATHGAEIAYVFGTLRGPLAPTGPDRALSAAMAACWVRFAKTGDPNGDGLPTWPAHRAETDPHLEFGDSIRVGSGLHRDVCDLLDQALAVREQRLGLP